MGEGRRVEAWKGDGGGGGRGNLVVFYRINLFTFSNIG